TVSSTGRNLLEVISAVDSFSTSSAPDNQAPKFLSGPDATSVEVTSATIEWTTDELSTSFVELSQTSLPAPAGAVFTDLTPFWVDADASGTIEHKVVMTGLSPNSRIRFRISATDISPLRNSIFSRYILFETAGTSDTIIPVLVSGPTVDVTDQGATIEWVTDEASDSFVLYRPSGSTDRFLRKGNAEKVFIHTITISNLVLGTAYEFEIVSIDKARNMFTWPTQIAAAKTIDEFAELRKGLQPPGGGGTYTTNQNPDTQLPIIIEGPKIISKTSDAITVFWKTDERGDSFVDFGLDQNYGQIKGASADVTSHLITLTNLTPGTLYNFRVNTTDPSSNGPTRSGNAAVTTNSEADVTPPKITLGPTVGGITNDQATITWETDELADTRVEFGLTSDLGTTRISTEDVTVHSITLTNLTSATEYHFKASSIDFSDNGPTSSANIVFTTLAAPDVTPPVISNITASAISDVSATITYRTDELGDTFVNFGLDASYGSTVGNATDVTEHTFTLTNLTANTQYHYQVGSIDKSGNETLDAIDRTFTTAAQPDTDPPAVPTGLAAESGSGKVFLSWNRNTEDDLAGYNIYRNSNLIATSVTDTFYFDNGLTNGDSLNYTISASDQQPNESSQTSGVGVTPDAANSPSVPSPFFPSDGQTINNGEINLQVDNATKPAVRTAALTYEFVIAEEVDFFNQVGLGTNVTEGSGTTIWTSNLTLADGVTYYWKARAFDGFFYSDWSPARSLVASASAPTSVTLVGFWAEENGGTVRLFWETSREIQNAGFNIYRSAKEFEDYEKLNEEMKSQKGTGIMLSTENQNLKRQKPKQMV
ncbi:hypothetical protein IIB79_10770, partial [candidate division KSB1 bacterium]|nr:hypothetical protein [candidate division KSB1 bacterium]